MPSAVERVQDVENVKQYDYLCPFISNSKQRVLKGRVRVTDHPSELSRSSSDMELFPLQTPLVGRIHW